MHVWGLKRVLGVLFYFSVSFLWGRVSPWIWGFKFSLAYLVCVLCLFWCLQRSEKAPDPLELECQMTVSHAVVLGTDTSTGEASTLNSKAIFQPWRVCFSARLAASQSQQFSCFHVPHTLLVLRLSGSAQNHAPCITGCWDPIQDPHCFATSALVH